MEAETDSQGFLTKPEMKKKPVFKEISIETGHPEHSVNAVTEQLEDRGFKIENDLSPDVADDRFNENVKGFLQNIEAVRKEKTRRKNYKTYGKIALIGLGVSIIFTILFLLFVNSVIFILSLLIWIITIVFFILWRPKEKRDTIWIKVNGKVYSGTKSREIRDNGKERAGQTKSSSTAYIHSELFFAMAGDSEIDVKRVRDDIATLSKFIQKI